MDPKWRILVVDFDISRDRKSWESLQKTIQFTSSEWFNECSDIVSWPAKNGNRSLPNSTGSRRPAPLDKKTLAMVGNFHGATHGVFGSLKPGQAGSIDVECSLIHLQSGQKVKIASTRLVSEIKAAEETEVLVDELLAKISSVKILYPRDTELVRKDTTVQGHIFCLPSRGNFGSACCRMGQIGTFHNCVLPPSPMVKFCSSIFQGCWSQGAHVQFAVVVNCMAVIGAKTTAIAIMSAPFIDFKETEP